MVRDRVRTVRELRAERRLMRSGSSRAAPGDLHESLRRFTSAARRELEAALRRCVASGRGVQQLVRVAETLSDLEQSTSVTIAHVEESVLLSLPSSPPSPTPSKSGVPVRQTRHRRTP